MLAPILFAAAVIQGRALVVDPIASSRDCSTLAEAVALARPDDRILLRSGQHSPVVIDKPVTLVAYPGSFVTGRITVQNIGVGQRVVMSGVSSTLQLANIQGAVIITDSVFRDPVLCLDVSGSSDVRLHNVKALPASSYRESTAVRANGSRVELYRSTLQGGNALNGDTPSNNWGCNGMCQAGNGGNGFEGTNSRLHTVLSFCGGGDGADFRLIHTGLGPALPFCATDAGYGIVCDEIVAVSARAAWAEGGEGNTLGPGSGYYGICTSDGGGGDAVIGGVIRKTNSVNIPGPSAFPRDPYLKHTGVPTPGAAIVFTMRGKSDAWAELQMGDPVMVDDGLNEIELLTTQSQSFSFGIVPETSNIQRTWIVPATAQPGDLFVFQGAQFDPASGQLLGRTNSVAIVVR